MGIVRGRIPCGIAVLWNKKLDLFMNVIRPALTGALSSSLFAMTRSPLSRMCVHPINVTNIWMNI